MTLLNRAQKQPSSILFVAPSRRSGGQGIANGQYNISIDRTYNSLALCHDRFAQCELHRNQVLGYKTYGRGRDIEREKLRNQRAKVQDLYSNSAQVTTASPRLLLLKLTLPSTSSSRLLNIKPKRVCGDLRVCLQIRRFVSFAFYDTTSAAVSEANTSSR